MADEFDNSDEQQPATGMQKYLDGYEEQPEVEAQLENAIEQEIATEAKYGDRAPEAALTGAASGLTLGLSDQALTKSGVYKPEELREIRERSPIASTVGEVAGTVAPLAFSVGTSTAARIAQKLGSPVIGAMKGAAVVEKTAAQALEKLIADTGRKKFAKEVLKKALPAAAGGAAEGSVLGLGESVKEDALGQADFNAENVVANLGSGALLGGSLGGIVGASKATLPEIGKKLSPITNRVKKSFAGFADPVKASQELINFNAKELKYLEKNNPELLEQLPGFLRDKAGLRTLTSTDELAAKVQAIKEETGSRIGALLDDIEAASAEEAHLLPLRKSVYEKVSNLLDSEFVQKYKSTPGFKEQIAPVQALKKDFENLAQDYSYYAPAKASEFHKIISEVRGKGDLFNANITPYTKADYKGFKTFLSPDKQSGYAIKPDGELISVFSTVKGRGQSLVDDAVVNKGAQKLDAFDINGKLPSLYGKYMDETQRFKFDKQYAPKDWNYKAIGEPDVVMMRLNPAKVSANAPPGMRVSPKQLQTLRQKMDELAYKTRSDLTTYKAQAARSARSVLRQEIDNIADQLSQTTTNSAQRNYLEELKSLNKDYNMASELEAPLSRKSRKAGGLSFPDIVETAAGYSIGQEAGLAALGVRRLLRSDIRRNLAILSDIEQSQQKVGKRIHDSIENFFKRGSKVSRPLSLKTLMGSGFAEKDGKKPKDRKEAMRNIRDKIAEYRANPKKFSDQVIKATYRMSLAAPNTAQEMANVLVRSANFLESKLPQPPQGPRTLFTREYEPSTLELAKFERYLQAVEAPTSVLDDLEDGKLTSEHVEALKAVYPALYQQIQTKVLEQVADKEQKVAYNKRVQLSILLDIPTDPSLLPENIAGLQSTFTAPDGSVEADAEAAQGMVKPTATGMQSLDLASGEATETQRIAQGVQE